MGLNRCGCHPVLYRNALIAAAARLTPDVKMTVHAEAVAMSLLNSLPRLSPASLALLVVLASTTAAATSQQPRSAGSPLAGTSWQLVRFQGGGGAVLTPDDGSKYTIAFDRAGNLSARIDCNRGRGTWASSGPGALQLSPLAVTRAMWRCSSRSFWRASPPRRLD